MAAQLHIRQWFTGPVTSYAEAADTQQAPSLPPMPVSVQAAAAHGAFLFAAHRYGSTSPQASNEALRADALGRLERALDGVAADWNDEALLDAVYSLRVAFINPCVPMYHAAEQMEGVVLDVKTSPRGKRQLLVKADKLSLPKWIALNDVQFVWETEKEQSWA